MIRRILSSARRRATRVEPVARLGRCGASLRPRAPPPPSPALRRHSAGVAGLRAPLSIGSDDKAITDSEFEGAVAATGLRVPWMDETGAFKPKGRTGRGKYTVAVAVSGGPDSTALVHLVRTWVQKQAERVAGWADAPAVRMIAVVVDHQLRPNSAREAAHVAQLLRAAGISVDVRTLQWAHGAPPSSKRMAAARTERYAAIQAACRKHRAGMVFIGHHADDQIETVVHRLARGSGIDGLAGMRALSNLAPGSPVSVVRPLLGVRKSRLVATCRELDLEFVEDPSNVSLEYDRARVRAGLVTLEAGGFELGALHASIGLVSHISAMLEHDTAELLRAAVSGYPVAGYALISADVLVGEHVPLYLAHRALTRLLQVFGGRDAPPRSSTVWNLIRRLRDGSIRERYAAGGCILKRHVRRTKPAGHAAARAKQVEGTPEVRYVIYREPSTDRDIDDGPLTPRIEVDTPVLWDNRFTLTMSRDAHAPRGRDAVPALVVRRISPLVLAALEEAHPMLLLPLGPGQHRDVRMGLPIVCLRDVDAVDDERDAVVPVRPDGEQGAGAEPGQQPWYVSFDARDVGLGAAPSETESSSSQSRKQRRRARAARAAAIVQSLVAVPHVNFVSPLAAELGLRFDVSWTPMQALPAPPRQAASSSQPQPCR